MANVLVRSIFHVDRFVHGYNDKSPSEVSRHLPSCLLKLRAAPLIICMRQRSIPALRKNKCMMESFLWFWKRKTETFFLNEDSILFMSPRSSFWKLVDLFMDFLTLKAIICTKELIPASFACQLQVFNPLVPLHPVPLRAFSELSNFKVVSCFIQRRRTLKWHR